MFSLNSYTFNINIVRYLFSNGSLLSTTIQSTTNGPALHLPPTDLLIDYLRRNYFKEWSIFCPGIRRFYRCCRPKKTRLIDDAPIIRSFYCRLAVPTVSTYVAAVANFTNNNDSDIKSSKIKRRINKRCVVVAIILTIIIIMIAKVQPPDKHLRLLSDVISRPIICIDSAMVSV